MRQCQATVSFNERAGLIDFYQHHKESATMPQCNSFSLSLQLSSLISNQLSFHALSPTVTALFQATLRCVPIPVLACETSGYQLVSTPSPLHISQASFSYLIAIDLSSYPFTLIISIQSSPPSTAANFHPIPLTKIHSLSPALTTSTIHTFRMTSRVNTKSHPLDIPLFLLPFFPPSLPTSFLAPTPKSPTTGKHPLSATPSPKTTSLVYPIHQL